jgi:hypothetical protein
MKLELKHIAPYAAFGLKVQVNYSNEKPFVTDLIGLNYQDETATLIEDSGSEEHGISCIKPILKSMDSFWKSEDWKEMESTLNPYMGAELKDHRGDSVYGRFHFKFVGVTYPVTYEFYQELFARHYDSFGLIEKGLAVDINTIDND